MPKQMSKTIEEYMASNGWSSGLFINHAKYLFEQLKEKVVFKIGRTVIYVFTEDRTIKFYVHHNGRSKEFMTITDVNGNELKTYHCTETAKKILEDVKQILGI